MKLKAIKFFSPEENLPKTKEANTAPLPAGYISNSGKLVFPATALGDLGIDPESTHFKIGTQDGKRKIKSLYLVYIFFRLQVRIRPFPLKKVAVAM
jgi:hypothetical protein